MTGYLLAGWVLLAGGFSVGWVCCDRRIARRLRAELERQTIARKGSGK